MSKLMVQFSFFIAACDCCRCMCRTVVQNAARFDSCSSWRGRTTAFQSTRQHCSRSFDASGPCSRQTPGQSSYTAGKQRRPGKQAPSRTINISCIKSRQRD